MFGQQLGVKAESTYGTPVTVDRFFEYTSESMKLEMGRTKGAGLRSGGRWERTDKRLPYRLGASGSVAMPVPTKGFGFWLKQAFGSADSVVGPTDSNYTQTHVGATKLGDMFTMQLNRQTSDEANQAFTYHGCKVTAMELSLEPEGVLMASFDLDAEDEDTSTSLASVSYTSGDREFSWANCSLTIAAAAMELTSFKFRLETPMNTARRLIRGSALKKQPLENDRWKATMELGLEFANTTQYARFQASAIASALGAVVFTADGDVAHGGTTVPRLEITMPNADFSEVDGPNASDRDIVTTTFTVEALHDGSSEAVTATYRTTDTAP